MLFGLGLIAQDEEWRFYQRDGSSLVRQTTNMQATVTLAWTYSPEGAVVLGEEGPVTNLDCSGNTIYDFSTDLIFKNGRYFDPNTGIWVTMGGLVVYQAGLPRYNRKRKWSKGKKRLILLFLLLVLALTLAGCGGNSVTPTPELECDLDSLTPKTLPINIVSLVGADGNLDRDLNYANHVFSQAKVTIEIDESLRNLDDSDNILSLEGDPTGLNVGVSDATAAVLLTREECLLVTGVGDYCNLSTSGDLFAPTPTFGPNPHTPRISNQNITIYYVPLLSNFGQSNIPGKYLSNLSYPNLPPSVIVGANADARTLPHELGHVFLGGGHPDGSKNFMVQSEKADINRDTGVWYDEMDWTQIQTIRSSSFLR